MTLPLEEFSAAQNGTYIGEAVITSDLEVKGPSGKFFAFRVQGVPNQVGILESVRDRCLVKLQKGAKAEIKIVVSDDKKRQGFKAIICESFGGLKPDEKPEQGNSNRRSWGGGTAAAKSDKEILAGLIGQSQAAAATVLAARPDLSVEDVLELFISTAQKAFKG